MNIRATAHSLLLAEFAQAFVLAMRYFFKPKPTLNYPFEKGPIWFFLKIAFILFIFLWARATLPRYRYDQLMRLGWKVFLPASLLWIVVTSGFLVATGRLPG